MDGNADRYCYAHGYFNGYFNRHGYLNCHANGHRHAHGYLNCHANGHEYSHCDCQAACREKPASNCKTDEYADPLVWQALFCG